MVKQDELTKLTKEIEHTEKHIRLLKERLKDPHESGVIKKWEVYLIGLLERKRELEGTITRFRVITYPWNPDSLVDCSFLDSYSVEAIHPKDSNHECLGKYNGCGKVELLRRLKEHYQVVESELVFV